MDAVQIGKTLRQLRGETSQMEAADKCQIARSTLAMYESGKRIPRDEIKVRIAKVYQKTVEEIFFAPNVANREGNAQ